MQIRYYKDFAAYQSCLIECDVFQLAEPCWLAGPLPRDLILSSPAALASRELPVPAGHPAQSEGSSVGPLRGKDSRRLA